MKKHSGLKWIAVFIVALLLVNYVAEFLKFEEVGPVSICLYGGTANRCFKVQQWGNPNYYYVMLDKNEKPFSILRTDNKGKIIEEVWHRSEKWEEDLNPKSTPGISI